MRERVGQHAGMTWEALRAGIGEQGLDLGVGREGLFVADGIGTGLQ